MTVLINNELSVFPILRTKRIIIGSEDIKVEALISTQEQASTSSWLSSSDFKRYVKFYFLLIPDAMASLASDLQNPTTRMLYLSNSNFGLTPDLNWRSNFSENMITEVDLLEVLQDNFNTTTPVSDLDYMSVNDIYFEATISTNNLDYSTSDRWHLLGFSHIDLNAITEDYGLSPSVFAPLGGNMSYDLLLEKLDGETLHPPKTVDALFTVSGNPYYGEAHYHDEQSPGPMGYIGWMAGHSSEMGERLTSSPVPYNKVVAKGFLLSEAFNSGYDGSIDYSFSNNLSRIASTGTGDSLLSALSATNDFIENASNSVSTAQRMKNTAIQSSVSNSANLFDRNQLSFVRVEEDPTRPSGVSDSSHHGALFFLNFLQLIKNNSELFWLIEAHENSQSDNSLSVLRDIYKESRIARISVHRRRLTNSTTGNTSLTENDYEFYDDNEIEKEIISTAQPAGSISLKSKGSAAGSIEEMFFETSESRPSKYRALFLKDYDLFHNVNYGRYTYLIDFMFQDGIKLVVQSAIRELKRNLSSFARFQSFSQIPISQYTTAVNSQIGIDPELTSNHSRTDQAPSVNYPNRQEAINIGCYNHETNSFTKYFRETAQARYYPAINSAITSFVNLYGKINPAATDEHLETLSVEVQRALRPENESCTPESIEIFVRSCKDLLSAASDMISEPLVSLSDRVAQLSVNGSDPGASQSEFINVRSRTRINASAIRNTDVLYEPSFNMPDARTQINLYDIRAKISNSFSTNRIVFPERFFTLSSVSTDGDLRGPTQIINREDFFSMPKQTKLTYTSMLTNNLSIASPRPSPGSLNSPMAPASGRPPRSSILSFDSLDRSNNLNSSIGSARLSVNFSKVVKSSVTNTNTVDSAASTSSRYLSQELESALCNAASRAESKEEYVSSVIDLYRDINFIKSELGDLYEELNAASVFLSEFSINHREALEVEKTKSNLDLIDKDRVGTTRAPVELENYLFEAKTMAASEILPGRDPKPFATTGKNFKSTKLVKYDNVSPIDDGMVLVNNVIIGGR